MQNINFSTATAAEMEAAGYTFTYLGSQINNRRRNSVWGVRPSMNRAHPTRKSLAKANERGTGKLRG